MVRRVNRATESLLEPLHEQCTVQITDPPRHLTHPSLTELTHGTFELMHSIVF